MNTMTLPRTSAADEPEHRSIVDWATRIGAFFIYGFVSVVLGAVGFSLVIALLSAGAATVIVWIGLPLLVAGVLVARGFTRAERAVQRALLGTDLPAPARRQAPPGAGWMRKLLNPLTDPQSWLDALWVLLSFILSLVTFPLTAAWLVGSFGVIGGPIATLILDNVLPPEQVNGLAELLGYTGPGAIWIDIALQGAGGLIFLFTIGPLVRALSSLHRGIARGLLSSRYEEQQQLVRAEQSRAAGRAAESTALRRLERDLHDGPQQRLVRASMDLARLEELTSTHPDKAKIVLSETRQQLAATLDDLRRLSRGIAPPVLVDRGLAAALAELAAICPIPTTVRCPDLDLPEHVEIGIYYVVSESLTNAAKHSGADGARVVVIREGENVRVRIDDDGTGGADIATGGGLAGLSGRVASLEGQFSVDSPAGAGTRIEAVIPCGS